MKKWEPWSVLNVNTSLLTTLETTKIKNENKTEKKCDVKSNKFHLEVANTAWALCTGATNQLAQKAKAGRKWNCTKIYRTNELELSWGKTCPPRSESLISSQNHVQKPFWLKILSLRLLLATVRVRAYSFRACAVIFANTAVLICRVCRKTAENSCSIPSVSCMKQRKREMLNYISWRAEPT